MDNTENNDGIYSQEELIKQGEKLLKNGNREFVDAKIDPETNCITWNLSKLPAGETATIQYKLKLKDEFDEKIIDQILNTNEKVDITYKDFDGTSKEQTSDVTPKIKLTRIPVDNTVAPDPIPKAGAPVVVIGMISAIAVIGFLGYKARKIK